MGRPDFANRPGFGADRTPAAGREPHQAGRVGSGDGQPGARRPGEQVNSQQQDARDTLRTLPRDVNSRRSTLNEGLSNFRRGGDSNHDRSDHRSDRTSDERNPNDRGSGNRGPGDRFPGNRGPEDREIGDRGPGRGPGFGNGPGPGRGPEAGRDHDHDRGGPPNRGPRYGDNRGYHHSPGHRHDFQRSHHRRYYPYYNWYAGFWSPGLSVGIGNPFGYGYGLGYRGYGYASIYNSYPGWAYYGLTPWGINQQAWTFGYWDYSNPYCVTTTVAPYNYTQPLVIYQQQPEVIGVDIDSLDSGTLPQSVPATGKGLFDQGLAAFRAGDSNAALDLVNQAIQQMPSDAVAHEFRSLVLFSMGRYDEAAESIYAVLAVDPGWDWQTMSGLYGNPADYTTQLRALEAYIGDHRDSSAARFLLAYHYTRCQHNEAAANQLKRVLTLTPGNKVATDLLAVIEGPETISSVPGAAPPILPAPEAFDEPVVSVKPESLHGVWSASSPDGTTFLFTLNADSTFKWTFTRAGKTEEVAGVWAIDEGTLALEPNAGGNMIGSVKFDGDQKFNFRMVGTVANDPGLNFERSAPQ